MKNKNLRKLTTTALFTAIVCIMTYVIKIPTANGYLNFGDCGVYLAAVIGGPVCGAFAGGMGSAFADIISGYAVWAVPTFIIKGIMGLFVGYYAVHDKKISKRNIILMIIAGVWMVLGYYFADILVFGKTTGGIIAAVMGMIPNALQNTVGIITSNIFLSVIPKINYLNINK